MVGGTMVGGTMVGGTMVGGTKAQHDMYRGVSKSPFHAKEFLPGGVPYDPNPRELFRGLTA
jgi:hypothetical protein